MKKVFATLACATMLSGCISLGAKPHRFECANLAAFTTEYVTAPVVNEIQARGYADIEDSGRTNALAWQDGSGDLAEGETRRIDPLFAAIGGRIGAAPLGQQGGGETRRLLMLSGGGQWGAFGAGFLRAMHDRDPRPYAAVTGVSTGALQAMLIGMGDHDLLVSEYRRQDERELIAPGGLSSAVKNGYVNNTDPLRRRVENLLCKTDTDCPGIARLSASNTQVFVGTVELATGRFQSFSITAMADAVHGRIRNRDALPLPRLTPRQARDCITGAVMGSVAVPVFMRPVTITATDPKSNAPVLRTHVDGGVRQSVFEAVIGSMAEAVQQGGDQLEIDIVRNGPTIVQPDKREPTSGLYKADAKPDAARNAMRSYAAIVNQTEVMSLAALRLSHPTGPIRFITADGYKAEGQCRRTVINGKESDAMFDIPFMHCLIDWGAKQAGNGWRTLPENAPRPAAAPKPGRNDQ